jgi:anti-sigma factor RsiW
MSDESHHRHVHSSADPACLEIFARLSDYLDGELTAADCDAIQAHIRDCPPCIDFVASLRRSIEAAQHLGCEERPAALSAETCERLRAAWAESLRRRGGPA